MKKYILIILGVSLLVGIILGIPYCINEFPFYENKVNWADILTLVINALGIIVSIIIAFLVYWFGSVKAEKDKVIKEKIDMQNYLFGQYVLWADKILLRATKLKAINKYSNESFEKINSKKPFFDEMEIIKNNIFITFNPLLIEHIDKQDMLILANIDSDIYIKFIFFMSRLDELKNSLNFYEEQIFKINTNLKEEISKESGNRISAKVYIQLEIMESIFHQVSEQVKNPLIVVEKAIAELLVIIKLSKKLINSKYKDCKINTLDDSFEDLNKYEFHNKKIVSEYINKN